MGLNQYSKQEEKSFTTAYFMGKYLKGEKEIVLKNQDFIFKSNVDTKSRKKESVILQIEHRGLDHTNQHTNQQSIMNLSFRVRKRNPEMLKSPFLIFICIFSSLCDILIHVLGLQTPERLLTALTHQKTTLSVLMHSAASP